MKLWAPACTVDYSSLYYIAFSLFLPFQLLTIPLQFVTVFLGYFDVKELRNMKNSDTNRYSGLVDEDLTRTWVCRLFIYC